MAVLLLRVWGNACIRVRKAGGCSMSLEQASEIQRKMYEFIVSYMDSEGMPPTNREIGRELKIASTGHVDYHLTMLEKKGLISRQAKKSRGIKLAKQSQ